MADGSYALQTDLLTPSQFSRPLSSHALSVLTPSNAFSLAFSRLPTPLPPLHRYDLQVDYVAEQLGDVLIIPATLYYTHADLVIRELLQTVQRRSDKQPLDAPTTLPHRNPTGRLPTILTR
jgi:hypothetical protein